MVDEPAGATPGDGDASQDALYTSEAALSLEEARTLTGRRGATLVLLLGEVGAGKTTLLVELWGLLLLNGVVNDHGLAGSRTALALEERAFHSRIESRAEAGTTARTQESDDGFVHFRIRRADGRLREILFADYSGEHFRRIREGTALRDELPWASRVDRFLIMVDGRGYATPGEQEVVVNRARRQILALRHSEAVSASARVAVVLTKLDELPAESQESYTETEGSLLDALRSVDEEATALRIAARPGEGTTAVGLDRLLAWICCDDRRVADPPQAPPAPVTRAVGRFVR